MRRHLSAFVVFDGALACCCPGSAWVHPLWKNCGRNYTYYTYIYFYIYIYSFSSLVWLVGCGDEAWSGYSPYSLAWLNHSQRIRPISSARLFLEWVHMISVYCRKSRMTGVELQIGMEKRVQFDATCRLGLVMMQLCCALLLQVAGVGSWQVFAIACATGCASTWRPMCGLWTLHWGPGGIDVKLRT